MDRYRERQYTLTHRHGKHFNIQLNQQIMRVSDTRELYHIFSTHAAEFDHVNLATGFRKVLQVTKMKCFAELGNRHRKSWKNVR